MSPTSAQAEACGSATRAEGNNSPAPTFPAEAMPDGDLCEIPDIHRRKSKG